MDALDALHTRTSVPKLSDPAPDQESMRNICLAALRAADHGLLRPWRFLVIREAGLDRLGDLFAAAARTDEPGMEEAALERIRQQPRRAPVIIVTIARHTKSAKVPELEQDISAGAATQNMLLAAHAQGIGAYWRTGAMAYHPAVKAGLGLEANEKIIGFLYLGTSTGAARLPAAPRIEDYFQEWPGA